MVKKTFVLTSLLLSGLTYANDYQGKTTEPIGSLHPVEMVCKASAGYVIVYDIPIPQGYVVVGETHDAICPGGGKNAWLTKVLESGDTICAATHQRALTQNISQQDSFHWQGYEVINQGYSPHCPENYTTIAPVTRTATNTATVQVVMPNNPFCLFLQNEITYTNSMIYMYGTAGISCPIGKEYSGASRYLKRASNTQEITCSTDHAGYVATNFRYSSNCDVSRETRREPYPLTTYTQVMPKRGITYEISRIPYQVLDWTLTTNLWITGAAYPGKYAGQKPNQTHADACMYRLLTPTGYRVTGFDFSQSCTSNNPTYNPNHVQIKKLTDDEEVFCIVTVSGSSVTMDKRVPNSYIVADKFHAPQCYAASAGQINAYKIRKLNSIDTVCKKYLREGERAKNAVSSPFHGEDDYGIIGETTLENCSTETNNAWVIKKLAETDTVCQTGFEYQYYPDYVIDSMAHLPSCSGTGNNAYNLRRLNEPEDLICLPPNDGGNFYKSFNSRGFDASYDTKATCGTLRAARIHLR